MNEVWRLIPTIERYEASNLGNIRNARTKRVLKQEKHKAKAGKEYFRVNIIGLKKGTHHRVHRLIAMAFIGLPPFEKAQVAHGDDNGLNNHCDNLSWKTHLQNNHEKKCLECPHCYADHHSDTGVCFIEGCFCPGYKVKTKEKVSLHVYGK